MECGSRIFSIEPDINRIDLQYNDEDECSTSEMESLFNSPYQLVNETAISLLNTYVLHLCGSRDSNPMVAAGFSDHTCAVYDMSQLTKVYSLRGHTASIANIKFNSENGNTLYTGSADGTVKLWDLRMEPQCIKEFKDNQSDSHKLKPFTSFDVTSNDRFLCAGTELIEGDAYLLFWDVRSSKLLGGYWETHTDDITQVRFHPVKNDRLATGSTDGLLNVFDISKSCEEDALLYSMNTQSSVDKIGWFSHHGVCNALSCITHTQVLQLWDIDGAAPFAQFSREKITRKMKCKSSEDCYLVDVHERDSAGNLILLCGSTAGRRESLRILKLQEKKMMPMSILGGNKQIVRASWYDKDNETLVTGGECGILNVWKPGPASSKTSPSELKANSKFKHNRHKEKPY